MPDKKISDAFNITNRFLRSAHLERDFRDSDALSGYVVTDFTRSAVSRVAVGLKPRSGQRAWRMTGNYGSGKSSFALLLAHWFSGRDSDLPPQIRRIVDVRQIGISRPQFVPVLVTCARQPLAMSILTALDRAVTDLYGRGSKTKIATPIKRLIDAKQEPTDNDILELILQVNSQVIVDSKAKGLLLILDEVGKVLEFAALHPERQDVFLLQRLAEAASRSGDEPLFVISLLHQGFSAYADHLDQSAEREWEKIAGRFEEIVFDQPVEQIADLVASALGVAAKKVPPLQLTELTQAMERTLALGWFGAAPSKSFASLAARLYPLHPTVLPVLIRTFRRFGQNERSLFSFLLSNEPFGLQAFAEKGVGELYRLHNFYDYVRANFGYRLAAQSYRSHWNLIDSVIETFATENELHVRILKTVGILNLLNDGDFLASEESILCALPGTTPAQRKIVVTSVEKLRTGKRVLWNRGRSWGLCLWPHTSVDLDKAYEDARRATSAPNRVATLIKEYLETRPIVARRHYIETGNLRYCEVRYCSVPELAGLLDDDVTEADGLIIVPLCETPKEQQASLACVRHPALKERDTWLVAIPQPLNNLASLVQEVRRWEWISTNVLELNADKFARDEVARQKHAARSQLERRVQDFVGFKQFTRRLTLQWFYKGNPRKIEDGRALLEELSRIFERVYASAPHIHNELVNRRSLSSAAMAARTRLIERMFNHAGERFLGMDPAKKPPEMSVYLSVLQATGLHQQHGGSWRIGEPHHKTDEKCRVLPALRRISDIVQQKPDARVNINALFKDLRQPPYGVRDGIIPLLLAVFAIVHEKDVALYKDGTFLRELNGETMLVLTKAPERFDIQYCKIEGVRAELFERLLALLGVIPSKDREFELLEVVRRLCLFVARLPAYVLNTKRLPLTALAVRDTILNAREPAKLVFTDLPKACDFEFISARTTDGKRVQAFVKTLKLALDDLRASYPELEERLRKQLRAAFDLPGSFQQFRTTLAARAEQLLFAVTEPKLRAFCLRLMDRGLPESDWLESLSSYLGLKPSSKWHDSEEDLFNSTLAVFAGQFHRVESIAFAGGKAAKTSAGVRLAITQSNGSEHEQVVHFSADEETQLRTLQTKFEHLLVKDRRLGLVAASRAIWKSLEPDRVRKNG